MIGKKFSDNRISTGQYDFIFVLRKSLWILLVGLAAFIILIPFATAGLPGDSIFNIEVTHEQMKFRLIHQQAVPYVAAAALIMGLITGMAMTMFIQDKKESTIFLSMGITRKQLFINRMGVGTLILAVCVFVSMGLSLWLNFQALGSYPGLVGNCIYLSIGILVTAIISMLTAAAVCFASGTLAEALVGWITCMGLVGILCFSINLLMKSLLWGNPWGVMIYTGEEELKPSLMDLFQDYNPILFFIDELETHSQFYRPLATETPEPVSWMLLVCWGLVAAVVGYAAWVLFRFRKAERAGISGGNRILPEIVAAFWGLLVFSLVFSFLDKFSSWMAVILGLLAFWTVRLFWSRTLFAGGAGGRKALIYVASQTVIIVAVCGLLAGGFLHNAENFMQKARIAKVEVSYVGAPAFLYEEASGSSTGRGYYLTSSITLEDPESIQKVKGVHRQFIDEGRGSLEYSGEDEQDTVVPYDVSFAYTDENGKKHIWYYNRASYEQLELLLSLEGEPEIREAQTALFTGQATESSDAVAWAAEAYSFSEIYLTNQLFTDTYRLTLGTEERAGLMEALRKDVESLSIKERYFPDGETKVVLMFSSSGDEDCQYYSYHLDNEFLYLTEEYKHTLLWLEEKQFLSLVQSVPEVEYILLQRMDPYIGMNALTYPMGMYFMSYCADTDNEFLIQRDFGEHYTYTASEEIQAILSGLRNGYFMTEGGYLAAVKLSGQEQYRYLFLPAGCIPDFMRR